MALNGVSTITVGDPVNWVSTKLARREAKLTLAAAKRSADPSSVSYRPYNVFVSPGTVSPLEGHPWLLSGSVVDVSAITTETGDILITEDGFTLIW